MHPMRTTAHEDAVTRRTRALYAVMPDAPPVPDDWSAVERTRHYMFCHAIAKMITDVGHSVSHKQKRPSRSPHSGVSGQ